MKSKLKLGMAVAVLATAGTFGLSKPMAVRAEESVEEATSLSSESSESKGNPLDSIEIDGKSLADWKKELADEATRKSAIIALVEFFAFAVIMGLAKLLQHKDVILNSANIAKTAELLKNSSDINADARSLVAEAVERYAQIEAEVKEFRDKSKEDAKEACAELQKQVEELQEVILVLLKNTPDFISADAYKKALDALNGKE